LAELVSLCASPLVSRLYSPEEMGQLAVFVSIVTIISVFSTLRFELVIPLVNEEREAASALVLSLASSVCVSLVFFFAMLFFGKHVSAALNAGDAKAFLWVVPVSSLAIGLHRTLQYWVMREKDYKRISKTKIFQGVGKSVLQVLLGFFGFGVSGLIIGDISGQILGTRFLSVPLLRKWRVIFKGLSVSYIGSIAKKYKKFPLVSSWSALIASLSFQLPILMITSLYGAEATGSFGFAYRIISAPMLFIDRAVSQVFFSEASSLARNNPKSLNALIKGVFLKSLLIAVPVGSVFVLFGPSLFSLIFGSEWREAGEYARILSFMIVARFAVNPVSQTLLIVEKQGTQLLIDVTRLVLVVVGFLLPRLMKIEVLGAVTFYSMLMVLVYLISYVITLSSLSRNENAN